jgi:hypothetical protein
MLRYRLDDDQGGSQPPKPWTGDKKPEDEKNKPKEDNPEKPAAA